MAEEGDGFDMETLLKIGKSYEMAYQGNVEDGAVLVGQSIGIVNSIETVPDIIDSIIKDAEKYIKKTAAYIK